MKIGYHITDKTRIGSIRRRGLIPRDTGVWNHPMYAKNEKAVYFFTDASEAERFRIACCDWGGRNAITLRINLAKIKLILDPSFRTLRSSYKTFNRIPPSAIL